MGIKITYLDLKKIYLDNVNTLQCLLPKTIDYRNTILILTVMSATPGFSTAK